MKQITNPDNNMWRSADPPQRTERVAARIGGGGLKVIEKEHRLSDKSYEGAVISLRNKTNATPARIGSYNTIYTAAHYNAGFFSPGTIKCNIFSSFTYVSHNNGVYSLETMILKTNYIYERQ